MKAFPRQSPDNRVIVQYNKDTSFIGQAWDIVLKIRVSMKDHRRVYGSRNGCSWDFILHPKNNTTHCADGTMQTLDYFPCYGQSIPYNTFLDQDWLHNMVYCLIHRLLTTSSSNRKLQKT
ncbi:hypothetical protein COP2_013617 [Malus domestica]